MTYQHSETFAQLKVIKEGIATSLTSYQWLQTLDFFIEHALDPIVTANKDLADNYFAKVVAWQGNKPSIKFTRDPKGGLPVLLFNSLTTEGGTKRKYQRAMLLNRGLLFGLLSVFEDNVNNYKTLHDPWLKLNDVTRTHLIHQAHTRVGSNYLYAAIIESEFWAKKAYTFKELILQKYVRLALIQAQRTYKEIKHAVSLDDIIPIYLSYLSKAIDRCDSRQGVLTTFIQTWFYSARTEVMRLSEAANNSSYDQLNDSGINMSSIQPDSKFEVVQHLAHEAKKIDPQGAVRFSLGIPEFLTTKQLQLLKLFATPQSTTTRS
jgi:hypothetical protein